MIYIRPAIKEMSMMDLVLLHKGTIGSNDPSDVEFRMEVLEEMNERLKDEALLSRRMGNDISR